VEGLVWLLAMRRGRPGWFGG